MNEKVMLVCNRADFPVTVRGSSFDHVCSECGARVMMAPSGQRVFRSMTPAPTVICLECSKRIPEPRINAWAAPTPEELARERASMEINFYPRRN